MNFEIFRTYDIRGIWQEDFDETDVEAIISSIFSYFIFLNSRSNILVLGHDARPSSKIIYQLCVKFALEEGFEIIALGLCTTPMVNCMFYLDPNCIFRIMITASHNPWEYNGFKLFYGNKMLWREHLSELAERTKHFTKRSSAKNPCGYVNQKKAGELIDKYETLLASYFIKLGEGEEFLVDCMHGGAGRVMRRLCWKIANLSVQLFRDEPFYEIEECSRLKLLAPDPSNPSFLAETILELEVRKLPFAVLFDGDGDRFVVVLASGQILSGDEMLCLYAEHLLSQGSVIMTNVATSLLVELVAKRNGLEVVRVPVGIARLHEAMHENNVLLGGETSSHFLFLKEHFCVDDGLFAAFKFLQILQNKPFCLFSWLAHLPQVYSSPIKKVFFSSRNEVLLVLENLKNYFQNFGYTISEIDGIRVFFSQYSWILLRASNTENCLCLRIQSDTKAKFELMEKVFIESGNVFKIENPQCFLKK